MGWIGDGNIKSAGITSFNMHSGEIYKALTDVAPRLERRDRDFMLIHSLLTTSVRQPYHAVPIDAPSSLLSLIMRL